jgi:hypothetical protein
MEIKINILEVASSLAHNELVELTPIESYIDSGDVNKVLFEEIDGVLQYTEESQNIFNVLYDKWFDFLLEKGEVLESEITNTDMWKYIEENYPKYYSCDRVAYLSDLECILDCTFTEGSDAEKLVAEFEAKALEDNPNLEGGYLTLQVYKEVRLLFDTLLQKLYQEVVQSKMGKR